MLGMTTYNTRNPLGSSHPKDLYDNAENLDRALNAAGDTWTDRLGVVRPTVAGALKRGTVHSYATQAEMNADSAQPNGTWAAVIDDDENSNGYYYRQGGQWIRTSLQPIDEKMLLLNLDTPNMGAVGANQAVVLESEDNSFLISIRDENGVPTWLEVDRNGRPSDWSLFMQYLSTGFSPTADSSDEYLFAVTDEAGNRTDLTVDRKTGQVPDWVLERWKNRLGVGVQSQKSTSPQVMSSISRAIGRQIQGEALTSLPIDLTVQEEPSRITPPQHGFSNTTPLILAMVFEGLGDERLEVRSSYMPIINDGVVWLRSRFFGNSYGSPSAMALARELWEMALDEFPIMGTVVLGNSMGGVAALNALTTQAIPSLLGVYLTDPVVDLRQRYDNGRAGQIREAYGIAADGSDYDQKTKGYDPALRSPEDFMGVPIWVTTSSLDTTVKMDLHTGLLENKLRSYKNMNVLDTGSSGHNAPDRFSYSRLKAFIDLCADGTIKGV